MTTLKLARETWRLTSSVSYGKIQGEHTSLVSQDKSQNESDNAFVSLVKSWQKSRRINNVSHTESQVGKSCEAIEKVKVNEQAL